MVTKHPLPHVLGSLALAAALWAGLPATSNANEGLRLWMQGSCSNCHGNRGQGGASSVDFPQGPSLRITGLNEAEIAEVISCGIPGTRMYASVKGAYTEYPCWGDTTETVPEDVSVIGVFTPEEAATLAAFIVEFIKLKKPRLRTH